MQISKVTGGEGVEESITGCMLKKAVSLFNKIFPTNRRGLYILLILTTLIDGHAFGHYRPLKVKNNMFHEKSVQIRDLTTIFHRNFMLEITCWTSKQTFIRSTMLSLSIHSNFSNKKNQSCLHCEWKYWKTSFWEINSFIIHEVRIMNYWIVLSDE